jgi:hypothetical protein
VVPLTPLRPAPNSLTQLSEGSSWLVSFLWLFSSTFGGEFKELCRMQWELRPPGVSPDIAFGFNPANLFPRRCADLNTYMTSIPPPAPPPPQPQSPQFVYVMQTAPPMPSMPHSWSNTGHNVPSSGIAMPTPYIQPQPQHQAPPQGPPPRFEATQTQPYRDPHPAPSAIVPPSPPRETTAVPNRPTAQETDVGPVDAPPPYNETLYIP